MRVTYDPAKRLKTLEARGLDFDDAVTVFVADHLEWQDCRPLYDEDRFITVGLLRDTVVVIVWTERDQSRRIISMRKADRDERAEYHRRMDRPG